jgi:PTS system sucrose-specific IIC component
VALGTGFLMTLILGTLLGKKKATVTTTDEVGENIFEKIHVTERKMAETQKNEIAAYADGVLIPIEEVDDDTFAQKVLGDGIAIIPENGNIYAPFDAEVVMVMDTGHAIGLMDKNNNEFLIHIGINTVNLNGKYFDVQAAVGDQVKMGDILVTEDIEKIKAEGYDMSVMLIATDANGRKIEKESPGKIKKGEKIAELV